MSSTSEAKPSSPSAAFEAALTRTAADRRGADRDLVEAVRDMDVAGESDTALELLAARPRVVLRLDRAVRLTARRRYEQAPRGDQGEELLAAELSPLGVALASCHPDGRVRRRAVDKLQELLGGRQATLTLAPFLVLRTADWARPVRDHARGTLAVLLHDQPKHLVPAATPLTLLLSRRERGSFARQQLVSALASEPGTAAFDQLLASPDPRLRRFALQTGLTGRRLSLTTLAAMAKRDGDRRCRELLTEAAVREAVWAERDDLLRQLAASSHREVRLLALVGLVKRGLAAEVTPYLGDASALARAVARDAARRTGADALAWYRAAVNTPTPGAIAGLAESGRKEDSGLLAPLLGHPEPLVRAAAIRGLRTMDAVPVDDVVPLLRDPSTKVIRQATAALGTRTAQLPPGLAESLLADRDRAAVRRAGYRLLHETDPLRRLHTALSVTADQDPRLSRWAADASATLIRSFHTSPWYAGTGKAVPPFDPTPDERRDLLTLAEAAGPRLHHLPRQLLLERLDPKSLSAELLRVRYGPHPDTKIPLLDVEATFTAQDPDQTIARIREVLLAVLPYAAGPAEAWPADDRWPDILPAWFVQHRAPETPAHQDGSGAWATWWRGLTGQQRETGISTDAAAGWRLPDWLGPFAPGGAGDSRSWRWWKGGARGRSTGWVRFSIDGRRYGGRRALLLLMEAAGGYDIDLP
ncbi:hypothetical protein [Streptomyces sp. NPDC049040]|uniref:hypothetical protein n=1 Tax=Streptomyces sp. NPDC049040 TaxID=3365593 RepID=UPI003711ACEE